jgi:hypothetical protein
VIGLRGKDGVVFAVEKLVTSKLYEPGANRRIFNIDKNTGMVSVLDIMNNNVHHVMFLDFLSHMDFTRQMSMYCLLI